MWTLPKDRYDTVEAGPVIKRRESQTVIVETRPREPRTFVSSRLTPVLSAIQIEQARLQSIAIQRGRAQPQAVPTEPLDTTSPDIMTLLRSLSPGAIRGHSAQYRPLPAHDITAQMVSTTPCWRIELHGLKPGADPLGIDVSGDVIVGRGSESDLDLDPYDGYEHAVSRRHAMLRPTNRQLYLIDMGSTNGTTYNMIPLGRCATYALQHNDVITLGLLTMTIKIIQDPRGVKVSEPRGA